MKDFTKFKLKDREALSELFVGRDNFTVLACKKCFKEFILEDEPECGELVSLLKSLGKSVSDCHSVDFLCNKFRTTRLLESLNLQGVLVVVSCGLGVQTVGALTELPVFTACDSIAPPKFTTAPTTSGRFKPSSAAFVGSTTITTTTLGQHSMSLVNKFCAGCGDCVLGDTHGICPVVDCAKSLLNGECGGAVGGNCEVDSDRDCAWATIAELQGVASEPDGAQEAIAQGDGSLALSHLPKHRLPLLHPPSLPASKISEKIRQKRLDGFYGGVYNKDCKEFSDFLPLIDFPASPRFVTIPMSQHKGTSADPIVSVGDRVKVGQKIGEAVGTLSSSIHSSVSGRVTAISFCCHPNLSPDTLAITIESDAKNELHNSVLPIGYWEDLDILDIDAIIAEKGIVGMGGAGFPTPIKLKSQKPIRTILINGCESEPYITADHRVMLENTEEILEGLKIILKSTNAERAIVVIGDNKCDAIELFLDRTSELPHIEILPVAVKYPQGSERMLIQRVFGIELEPTQRPNDIGIIVLNVNTTKAIGDAFLYGTPLINRPVTVTGECMSQPANFMIPIGTSVSDILSYCNVLESDGDVHPDISITLGGTMMGTVITDFDIPVIKGTHGILIQPRKQSAQSDCIRCGRCVDVCPTMLLPLYYSSLLDSQDYDKMADYNVFHCIECGCCDYICPSRIEIRRAIKAGKKILV
ncbi:MAG: electron transport complex subunit RsxC [Oscillospiraceae bacterium]|nr:electron transport complex subunit RsxC [Oscillospiraceae bacterium]MCL2279051.1 electron transport complex subunit RsxC [Oscillospiraceae bacterium]